jgi:hypothetical protein
LKEKRGAKKEEIQRLSTALSASLYIYANFEKKWGEKRRDSAFECGTLRVPVHIYKLKKKRGGERRDSAFEYGTLCVPVYIYTLYIDTLKRRQSGSGIYVCLC